MSDNLSTVFDVNPLPSTEVITVSNKLDQRVSSDADYARNNIKDLIDTARTALTHALDIAVAGETPRGFEVVSTLIDSSVELNMKLLSLHKLEQSISEPIEKEHVKTITNNSIVFQGTSSDLNDMITKRLMNR